MDEVTYSSSAKGVRITRERAIQEIRDHGHTYNTAITEFYADLGDHDDYSASNVLDWLGY